MSNFKCEKCGTACYDTPNGYITGCEHYPADIKRKNLPQRLKDSLKELIHQVKELGLDDTVDNPMVKNNKLNIIKCFVCGNSFAARFPKTGDSVTCPHCGAEGHGTYDEGGNYMLEWNESDTWS